MIYRIGDYVIIAPPKSRTKPPEVHLGNSGRILDIKWNMARISFKNGSTDWIELMRVYHDNSSTPQNH